jgi:hypothetical protein
MDWPDAFVTARPPGPGPKIRADSTGPTVESALQDPPPY